MSDMVLLPANCYGQIYMYIVGSEDRFAFGTFNVSPTVCQAFITPQFVGNSGTASFPLRFGSGTEAVNLNLRVKSVSTGNWQYRITYWAK